LLRNSTNNQVLSLFNAYYTSPDSVQLTPFKKFDQPDRTPIKSQHTTTEISHLTAHLTGRLNAEEEEHLCIKAKAGIARLKAEEEERIRIQTEHEAVVASVLGI